MHDNFSTLWSQDSLNRFAEAKVAQAIEQTGRALPCVVQAVNGSLVTVAFEVSGPAALQPVTMPIAMSQWARVPVQVGDVGVTVPADTFLGGISGQGSGTADPTKDYGNLTTLIFMPIAATSFPTSPNANTFWGNGPAGARIGDSANGFYVDCDVAAATVTLYCGATKITLSSSGVAIAASGKTWTFGSAGFTDSNGIVEETHVHGGVTTGSSPTLGPEVG